VTGNSAYSNLMGTNRKQAPDSACWRQYCREAVQFSSSREIAAFLGHANTNSVREDTRFDHKALRKIADFSLEGLL